MPEPLILTPELSPAELGQQLMVNLAGYIAEDQKKNGVLWDRNEVIVQMKTAIQFAKNLRNTELSEPYARIKGSGAIDRVRFEVMNASSALVIHPDTLQFIAATAQLRRSKAKLVGLCHGYDPASWDPLVMEEISSEEAGKDAARETQLEIRHAEKEGQPIRVYAMYLPPFMGPLTKAQEDSDFIICRGLRVRYAKIY